MNQVCLLVKTSYKIFPFLRQGITKVTVYKRSMFPYRSLSLAVRAGRLRTPDRHGLSEIKLNKLCGETSASTSSYVSTVNCVPEIDAQYVNFQSKAAVELNIAEVNIFAASK